MILKIFIRQVFAGYFSLNANVSHLFAFSQLPGSSNALVVVVQEVQVLARCRSQNITQYYASVLQPGSTELMIVMELMAASVFDVVRLSAFGCAGICCCLPLLS